MVETLQTTAKSRIVYEQMKTSKVPSVATLHVLSAFDVEMSSGSAPDLDKIGMNTSVHLEKSEVLFQNKRKVLCCVKIH